MGKVNPKIHSPKLYYPKIHYNGNYAYGKELLARYSLDALRYLSFNANRPPTPPINPTSYYKINDIVVVDDLFDTRYGQQGTVVAIDTTTTYPYTVRFSNGSETGYRLTDIGHAPNYTLNPNGGATPRKGVSRDDLDKIYPLDSFDLQFDRLCKESDTPKECCCPHITRHSTYCNLYGQD
jgi:hypothetical protein